MTNLFKMSVGNFNSFVGVLSEAGLTAELAEEIRHNPAMANRMVAALRVPEEGHPYRGGAQPQPAEAIGYFVPLTDANVPAEHQETLAKYRKLAAEHSVPFDAPLCYKVRAGFTLKKHAPQAGPCFEGFQYLQEWDFEDRPITDCLVFWVPRLVKGSTSKTVDEQMQLLSALRQRFELPEYHLSSFGDASLVSGIILAHFKAMGERVPFDERDTRTDTYSADGGRLTLGEFGGRGLTCGHCCWDVRQYGNLGVFALGVVLGS